MSDGQAESNIDELRELVVTLFLCIGWDGRQALKNMLSQRDREKLVEALGAEPNW